MVWVVISWGWKSKSIIFDSNAGEEDDEGNLLGK